MKKFIKLGTLLALLIFYSCGVKIEDNKKNNAFISKQCQENGNVFFIRSTYVSVTIVWTYSKDYLTVYKLSKGKVLEKKMISISEKPLWFNDYNKNIDFQELNDCQALDGEILGFQINGMPQEKFAIILECFESHNFKSIFLYNLSSDIKQNHIKW